MLNFVTKRAGAIRIVTVIIVIGVVAIIVATLFSLPGLGKINYRAGNIGDVTSSSTLILAVSTTSATSTPIFIATHISPPPAIKGVYFTSWAAGTPSFRKHMLDLLDGTILNSVVIDVKDYSGRIAFDVSDPELVKVGAVENRIPDIKEFIADLHKKGVYVIGRVAVFQDPFLVKARPEWAVTSSTTGKIWKDSGGMYWVDPTIKDVWDYTAKIARESYAVGFDEINFDYIRFPSDGNVSTIKYSALPSGIFIYKPIVQSNAGTSSSSAITDQASSTKPVATSTKVWITGKSKVMRDFFSHLHSELVATTTPIPISVDLFGQTTSDTGDMGIGQLLENAMPYFNYIDPMVYPSHYINGFLGFDKPAKYPYEIVKHQMGMAVARSIAASSSPMLMRPWLQAFDLGAIYTPDMIHAQIRATYDAGLTSWILWNAGSKYDKAALLTDPKPTAITP